MNRLRKYEILHGGGGSGRIAYVLDATKLPNPAKDCTWQPVPDFNAADEVLENPELKETYRRAIADGVAIWVPAPH